MTPARPTVPMRAQRDAALYALGLDPATAELDHNPALGLRYRDPVTGQYEPPANDPRYLVWRAPADHACKTFKDNGTGRGDLTAIAKVRRLSKDAEAFRGRLLAKEGKDPELKKSRWPKRRFPPARASQGE